MMMNGDRQFVRWRALFVVASLAAVMSVRANAAPYDSGQKPVRVEGVHFTVAGGQVIVSYDLLGTPNDKYNVRLVLKRTDDSAYAYFPKSVSGDIGVGHFDGANRQIVWQMDQEFPEGLPGSDYYFVVEATIVEHSSSSWLPTILGAGATMVAAAVTYVLISGKPPSRQPTSSGFPPPPGRP